MNLTTDEAKMVVETFLDDLSMVGEFLTQVASLPPEPSPGKPFPGKITKFVASLAIGKAAIVRMLIDKDEDVRPNAEGMEVLEKWSKIEDAILEEANNDS